MFENESYLHKQARNLEPNSLDQTKIALTQSIQLPNYLMGKLRGLVLGFIEAKFRSTWKALDEFYPIYFCVRFRAQKFIYYY